MVVAFIVLLIGCTSELTVRFFFEGSKSRIDEIIWVSIFFVCLPLGKVP